MTKIKKQKLVIIALGKRNSGKSNTWYEIFDKKVIRSGKKRLRLNNLSIDISLRNASFEEYGDDVDDYFDVDVRNASFEEYGDDINDYFTDNLYPNIVFCSVQYIEKGIRTIDWFKENGYYLYIQWINPGYYGAKEYSDSLGFEDRFKSYGKFIKHSGKEKINRVDEIRKFLYNWIK